MAWFDFFKRSKGDKKTRKRGAKSYVGARQSRRNSEWFTGGDSGNAALSGSQKNLRQRSRDLKRNDRYGRHGMIELASYMSGLRPMSAIPIPEDADDAERKRLQGLNRQVDRVFKAWSQTCDVSGELRFEGLLTRAVLGMIESGETFTRLRVRRVRDGLAVPFQVEVLEADFVDHTMTKATDNGGFIMQGVEFDPVGRRSAYHMFRRHPGEAFVGAPIGNSTETSAVPASSVAHLYPAILSRPGQARGEPWFAAVIQGLKDFDGYADAERVRLRGSASLMGVVESEEEFTFSDDDDDEIPTGINPLRDADGNIVERIRPGTFAYAQQGQKIKFNSPPATQNFESYVKTDLHGLAAGVSMPYELFAKDLSQTNFSSIMFGMGSFWRLMRKMQFENIIPQFCDRIWNWFVVLGVLSGALPAEAGPVNWIADPWPLVDPVKQANGRKIMVRSGAMTLDDWIAETGKDPDLVKASVVETQKWARENGVLLDSIPSTTTLAGQAQTEKPADSEDENSGDGDGSEVDGEDPAE